MSGHYGEDVHHLLAEQKLHITPKNAAKAYVMEYLQPSSWKDCSIILSIDILNQGLM